MFNELTLVQVLPLIVLSVFGYYLIKEIKRIF